MPGASDFRVTEDGREVPIVEFQAPVTSELIPTTLVLVVDRSGSMRNEDRIGGLKRAVAAFLEKLPEGSRVALVSFASEVDRLSAFTTDLARVREAVDGLEADGSTRFYDAVATVARAAARASRAAARCWPSPTARTRRAARRTSIR